MEVYTLLSQEDDYYTSKELEGVFSSKESMKKYIVEVFEVNTSLIAEESFKSAYNFSLPGFQYKDLYRPKKERNSRNHRYQLYYHITNIK